MRIETQRKILALSQRIISEWYKGRTDELIPLLDDKAMWIGAAASQFYRGRTEVAAALKKVSEDIEGMKFNTAIAALMTLLNDIYNKGSINNAELKTFVTLLNPFAPHVTEEIWAAQNYGGMLADGHWVDFDEAKCIDDEIEIVAQINGKVRAKLMIPAEIDSAEAIELAKKDPAIAAAIEGKNVVKELYVKGRLVNIVVK